MTRSSVTAAVLSAARKCIEDCTQIFNRHPPEENLEAGMGQTDNGR